MAGNAHDAFFKAIFHSPEAAAAALRRALPAPLSAAIDWDGLHLLSGEYVDGVLGGSRSDLVFEAPLAETTAVICFMMEHQSRPERWMVLRALDYGVQFWQRRRRIEPAALKVPLIIPVVLYNGARPWSAPTTLAELLDVPDTLGDALAEHIPRFRLLVDDLSRADDAEIEASVTVALALVGLLLLKNAAQCADWAPLLERLVPHLIAVARRSDGVEVLQQALVYSYGVSEMPAGTIEARLIGRVPPDVEETMITTAERLREEGRTQGLEQGLEQGMRLMLTRLLSLKVGPLPTRLQAAIDAADEARIIRWSDHFMVAENLTLADAEAVVLGPDRD